MQNEITEWRNFLIENEFKHENEDMHFAIEITNLDYHESKESFQIFVIIQAIMPNNNNLAENPSRDPELWVVGDKLTENEVLRLIMPY